MLSTTYMHLAAYYESIANGVANVDVAAVNDGILTRLNGHFVLPQDGKIIGVYNGSANFNRGRLNTPSLRYVGLPSTVPGNASLTVPSPMNFLDWTQTPVMIPKVDEIAYEGTQDGGGAEVVWSGILFGFGRKEIPGGNVYRLRGTAAITCAAGTWVSGSITMDSTLPQGRYALVGMIAQGANLGLARLIFPGASFRPGCVAINTLTGIPADVFTNRSLGVFGEFESINLPNLECLSVGACTAQTVFLDVIRTGGAN